MTSTKIVSLTSKYPILSAVLLLFVTLGIPARADITGKAVRVFDGDTLEIMDSQSNSYRVRLQGIDAPERGQPFSSKSRKALSDLVFGKEIKVVTEGMDKFERFLGQVYVQDKWINREMLRMGMAWHYKYFNKDPRLAHSEIFARHSRLGLWSEPNPTAPWVFRRSQAKDMNPEKDREPTEYWLNSSTGVRHNKTCRHFMNTSKGRFCGPHEGRPCGECGG